MAGPMELGRCPYCRELKPVTAAGVMRKHSHPVQLCQGSGHPPIESQCGAITITATKVTTCVLRNGHDGPHSATPGPLMQRAGFKP